MNAFNLLFLLLVGVALWSGVRHIKQHGKQDINSSVTFGLNALLYLSGAAILLGCIGYFMKMRSDVCMQNVLPRGSFVTVLCTVPESAEQLRHIATCFLTSSSVMMTALLSSLILAIVWFLLHYRTKRL